MSVRAKFVVKHITEYESNPCQSIHLQAVVAYEDKGNRSDENEQWSKWTPSGQIDISITNPDAFNQFKVGKEYHVDFNEVPATNEKDENV